MNIQFIRSFKRSINYYLSVVVSFCHDGWLKQAVGTKEDFSVVVV